MDELDEKMDFALCNQKEFDTLDDDYEVICRADIALALRNLDNAMEQFNRIYKDSSQTKARFSVDGVFKALQMIKTNLENAVKHQYDIEDEDEDDPLCPCCAGSGEGMYDGTRCHSCKGKGTVSKSDSSDDDYGDYLHDMKRDDELTR